jgi:hypothetical protein
MSFLICEDIIDNFPPLSPVIFLIKRKKLKLRSKNRGYISKKYKKSKKYLEKRELNSKKVYFCKKNK